MRLSSLLRALAPISAAALAMLTLPQEAAAQSCDAGWVACVGGCIPADGTCCGTTNAQGLPEYCAASAPVCCDGGCAASPADCGGGSPGPDSCQYAFDGVCDEPEYCPAGTDSTDCSGGSGTGGGGGGCEAGWESCDGGCMPSGATCCFDGAHYCGGGEVCCSDGCYPAGTSCGSSAGNDSCQYAFDGMCDEPEICAAGTDATDCGGSGGGSWGGDTTPGGSTPGAGGTQCVAAAAYEGCESVDACCDGTSCWYVTDDGSTFYCSDTDCSSAAEQTIAYCEDQSGACAAAPIRGGAAPGAGFGLALIGAAALAVRRRIRRVAR
jgi:hypothetical protein